MRVFIYLNLLIVIAIISIFSFGCGVKAVKSSDLLNQADSLFKANDYEQARAIYEKAAAAATTESDNSALTEAYSQIARCFIIAGNLDEGRVWLSKAEKIANPDQAGGWSRFLGVRGRLEWQEEVSRTGEFSPVVKQAADTFKEMYDYCLEQKLYSRAIDAAHMVAIVSDMDDRIEWGLKGIKAAEEGNIAEWLGPLWNNHGWNLDEMGKYAESLQALLKAREYHYRDQDEMAKIIADWSVGHAYRMVGQLDTARTWITDVYNRAVSRYENDPSGENAEWVGFAKKELGEIALAQNLQKEALEYLIAARVKLEEAGMPDWDGQGFEELGNRIVALEQNPNK